MDEKRPTFNLFKVMKLRGCSWGRGGRRWDREHGKKKKKEKFIFNIKYNVIQTEAWQFSRVLCFVLFPLMMTGKVCIS